MKKGESTPQDTPAPRGSNRSFIGQTPRLLERSDRSFIDQSDSLPDAEHVVVYTTSREASIGSLFGGCDTST
jgi:hypothetical protein